MKIRIAKLTGRALDYAVALAKGGTNLQFDTVATYWITIDGKDLALSSGWAASMSFAPSSSSVGDDIIDREKIETRWCVTDSEGNGYWMAQNILTDTYGYSGPTRRIAAMRCYVASVLGDEIDLPETLK